MKIRYSVRGWRRDKQLSFITFLKGSDEVVFRPYGGTPPSNWDLKKDDVLYYLKACQRVKHALNTMTVHNRLYMNSMF